MGRNYEANDEEIFDDYETNILEQVRDVFTLTTYEERFMQLDIWATGQHETPGLFCLDRKISKIALLLAAMFETAYPLLFDAKKDIQFTVTGCMVKILDVELLGLPCPAPDPSTKMIFTY